MTFFLLACGTGEDTGACVDPEVPRLTLSESELGFGYRPLGERAERIVTLSNTGTVPLAVTDIGIGDDELPDFDVAVGTADCVTTDEVPDTSDDTGGGGSVWVLAPGCEVPLTVGYTPVTSDAVQNALVVRTESWRSAEADPVHAHMGVWLSGETDASDVPAPASYVVGSYLAVARTAIHEAEQVELSIRTVPEDATLQWSAEGGTLNGDAHTVTYTAGAIDGCSPTDGRNNNIYVVVADPDGDQDWAFSKLAVWDAAATIDACPEVTCGEEDTAGDDEPGDAHDADRADDDETPFDRLGGACGCADGNGAAVIGVGLGLLGLTVRRRR